MSQLFLFSEYATSSRLQSEDWALNMDICDIINETEEGCVSSDIMEKKSFDSLLYSAFVV
jgi:hypothetical protein